ncbi:MAG: CocE/NonD family hydrolase, partial [Pyrinomonadaceae bacterium]|nr:CocE/NonD family hydrolase [Pyrinomonadaceae bacterium]
VVTLYVTSTHKDGAFFVYLEDVDEAGKVTYLTEGQLRAIHRKVSNDAPPYTMPAVPYHTFRKKDAMPLVPTEIAELKFALLPTSVLIRKGHRIRVAIAGQDKSVFARVPADGTPTISLARNKQYASFIELPTVSERSKADAPSNLLTYFVANAGKAAIEVNPKIYDAYVGQYELKPGFIITVSKEGEKLMAEAPGQPKLELFPESETKFFLKVANLQIIFIKDKDGQTSGLILRQNAQDLTAKKIK